MNLFAVYSITSKGIRKRNSMLGSLLSPTQAKVLAQVDGKATIKMMLNKLDNLKIDDFERAISTLQQNGYIEPVTLEPVEWLPTANFTPMIIEEFSSLDEVAAQEQQSRQKETEQKEQQKAEAARARAEAKVKAELEAEAERLAAEQKAKEEMARKAREAAELKAHQEAEAKAKAEAERQAREVEEARQREETERKARAEAAEKARIEAERLEAEKRAKEEAERQAAEQKAKEEAELKARQEAEARAKAEAEEQARLEAERQAREAEEARQREETERKAKEEAEEKARIEAERLAAEQKAKEAAEEQARIEAEQRAKEEADAKAKAAAEERARLEIERITREAKEAKQREVAEKKARKEAERIAAEQKAKEEAELKARQEAEAKAKAEAEEQARLEAERQAREAEEARQREEAERQAREEAERIAAEQKAKEEAETRALAEEAMARMDAEERARAEAEEMARREVERMAQELEAAKQKVEADKKAKKEAEKKAKEEAKHLAAEQKAREKAEAKAKAEAEKARQQAEKAAREAEEAEKKRQTEEKALQAERLQALIRAEQRQEAAHLRKMDLERAERNALKEEVIVLDSVYDDDEDDEPIAVDSLMQEMVEDDGFVPTGMDELDELPSESPEDDEQQRLLALKRAAAAEREQRQKLTLLERKQALLRKLRRGLARPARMIKTTLHTASLLVLLLLFVALGLLPYVPLNALVEPAEQLAREQLGTEVKIHKVSAALVPRPHLMLKDVEIGTHGQRIGQINAWPAIGSLKDDQKVMKALEIHDATITHENFGQTLDWLNALGNSPKLKIESIRVSKVALSMHDFAMGEFEGEVVQSPAHQVQHIQLRSTDQKLHVKITPRGGSAEIALDANNWELPLHQGIKFRKLAASGMASRDKLQLNQIKAELYEGELAGQLTLGRSNRWDLTGNLRLENANAAEVIQAFGSPIKISGQMDAQAALNSHVAEASKLAANTDLSADFNIHHGEIDRLDLSRLVLAKSGQSLAGDSTRFDSLQGMLQISQQQYRLKNLALGSKQLSARGDMTITADGEINGNFSASLAAQSRRYNANTAIGGRGSDIKLH